MKKISIFHILLLFLSCASDPEQARSNKYLNEENNESIEKILGKDIDNVIDFYPIPDTKIQLNNFFRVFCYQRSLCFILG